MATTHLGTALLALAWAALTSAGCSVGVNGELVVTDDASADSTGSGSGSSSGGGGSDGSSQPTLDGGRDDDGAGDDASPMTGPNVDGSAKCNFSGTWATKLTIAVDWVPQGLMGVILAPGSGAIQQWILSNRVQNGALTTDTAVVCGIALPDFSGTSFVGGETYGVRFPDSLFDNAYIPKFAIPGTLSDSTPNAKFATAASAALLGLTLPSAATAAWPATVTTAVDSDMDMHAGITATAAGGVIPGGDGGTYQNIPVDVFKARATELYLAIRQVTQLSGAASDCDHISGTVKIPKIQSGANSKYTIDSHVLGCGLAAGGECTAMQTSFVDGTQPVFSPSGATAFTSVRMNGATCTSVRQALP